MSFWSSLFGPTTQTSTSGWDNWTQQQRNFGADLARRAAGQGYQRYNDPTVAGVNPLWQQGMGMALDPNAMNPFRQAAGGLGFAQDWYSRQLNSPNGGYSAEALQPFMNPYQQNVLDAAQQTANYNRQLGMNAITGQMGGGAFRNSRAGVAAGTMNADLARQMAELSGNLGFQSVNAANQMWLQNQGQQQNAAQMAAGMGQWGAGGMEDIRRMQAGAAQTGGDYLRNLQQQQLNSDYGQWQQQRDWSLRQAQAAQGLLPFMNFGTQTQRTQTQQPLAGQLAGMGMMAAGMFGGGGAAMAPAAMSLSQLPQMSSPYMNPGYQPFGGGLGFGGGMPQTYGNSFGWNPQVFGR